jgi:hypothetical protein
LKTDLEATAGQWKFLCCETYVQLTTGMRVSFTRQCAACGNTNLRFLHILEHDTDGRQIEVGVECAGVLLNDYKLPRLAEDEVKRKEYWRREVYHTPGRCSVTIADLEKRGKL